MSSTVLPILNYLETFDLVAWERRDLGVDSLMDSSKSQSEPQIQEAVATYSVVGQNRHLEPTEKKRNSPKETFVANEALLKTTKQEVATAATNPSNMPGSSAPIVEQSGANKSQGTLVLQGNGRWERLSLLVICKHGEQHHPNSFCNNGRPSKTMSQVLKALDNHIKDLEISLTGRLGLAQMGSTLLSEQSKHTHEALHSSSPKALLLMGEEAANFLTGEQRSFAQWQTRVWKTPEGISFIVTYHPEEIFRSPSLKKQVYQDLIRIGQILQNE